jgi:hypothetical protein
MCAAAGVQARSHDRKQDAVAFFVLILRGFHRMRSTAHRHVHQLDRRDHAVAQPHQSLQRDQIVEGFYLCVE